MLHGEETVEIPGARALLDSLVSANASWVIVTSGTIPLVTGWLDVLKLSPPNHLVTTKPVEEGKPDPAGYRLGRQKLKLESDARQPELLSLKIAQVKSKPARQPVAK